jgi:hypothetical protein
MRNHSIHNTVAVRLLTNNDQYGLFWQDDNGNNSDFIVAVHGLENAIRVANGIAHRQCEYVKHPSFKSDEVAA